MSTKKVADAAIEQPTAEEVQLEEVESRDAMAIPVTVEGPVRAQLVPGTTAWSAFQLSPDTTTPQRLLGADVRRKRAVISTETAAILLGGTSEAVKGWLRFRLAVDTPLEITHSGEVWVIAASGSPVVSVITETWTE
jgi:hypothetical protein